VVYRLAAELVVLLHLAFILFAALGGLLALRWRGVVWGHVPAVVWAALIEFQGWLCPLTPLENRLREAGGAGPYETGFIEHYLLPIIYPAGLTRETQLLLGVALLALNAAIYAMIIVRSRRSRP
jgi:hypothetical protein